MISEKGRNGLGTYYKHLGASLNLWGSHNNFEVYRHRLVIPMEIQVYCSKKRETNVYRKVKYSISKSLFLFATALRQYNAFFVFGPPLCLPDSKVSLFVDQVFVRLTSNRIQISRWERMRRLLIHTHVVCSENTPVDLPSYKQMTSQVHVDRPSPDHQSFLEFHIFWLTPIWVSVLFLLMRGHDGMSFQVRYSLVLFLYDQ